MNSALTALVNGLIVSALITTVIWFVMSVSKRAWNAATRYAIWWVTLLITAAMPLLYLDTTTPHETSTGYAEKWGLASPAARQALPATNPAATRSQTPSLRIPSPASEEESLQGVASPSQGRLFPIQILSGRRTEWILIAWMLTSALMLVRLVVSYVLLERRKARAMPAAMHQALLGKWLALCGGAKRKVQLRISPDITTPIAAGPYRSSILIPVRMMNELNEDELHQIGLHESAHFSRRDDYALIFQRILEALFVFHPVVRWITRQIDLEREIACDDFVIKVTGTPLPYAACLTRVVELAGGVCSTRLAASAAEPRSHLERRVDMLLDDRRKIGTHLLKRGLAAAAAAIFVMIFIAANSRGLVLFATEAKSPINPVPLPVAAVVAPAVSTEDPRPVATAQQTPLTLQTPLPTAPAATNPTTEALVRVPVVVTDARGRYVSGLEKEHFTLFEDKVEQNITQFSRNGALSLAVVYDIRNGSVGRDLLIQSLARFSEMYEAGDEVSLVYGLDAQPQLSQGLGTSVFDVGFFGIGTGQTGPTALLDGVQMAIDQMKSARNAHKIILILSDGNEHSNSYKPEQVSAMANATDAEIYVISLTALYEARVSAAETLSGPALLDVIAEESGGRHFAITNTREVPSTLTKINVEWRNSYLIGFQSSNAATDGKYRRLLLRLQPPRGVTALNVHSRPGYLAAK